MKNRKREWLKEWFHYTFNKVKFARSETNDMIPVENLRIVKIYIVTKETKDEYGFHIATESKKATENFALAEKIGNMYRVFPTNKFSPSVLASLNIAPVHGLFVKKTRSMDRYRKPIHLCKSLMGKAVSTQDACEFAEMVSKIKSDFRAEELNSATKKLEEVCETFNKYLDKKLEKQEEKIL